MEEHGVLYVMDKVGKFVERDSTVKVGARVTHKHPHVGTDKLTFSFE